MCAIVIESIEVKVKSHCDIVRCIENASVPVKIFTIRRCALYL